MFLVFVNTDKGLGSIDVVSSALLHDATVSQMYGIGLRVATFRAASKRLTCNAVTNLSGSMETAKMVLNAACCDRQHINSQVGLVGIFMPRCCRSMNDWWSSVRTTRLVATSMAHI